MEIAETHWKALADAIERKLTKQQSQVPPDPDIERLATHYAQLIVTTRQQAPQPFGEPPPSPEPGPDYALVDVNSTTTSTGRIIGAEHVAVTHLKELGFFEILQGLGFSEPDQRYAAVLVVGRMVNPSSEAECARWVREQSALANCSVEISTGFPILPYIAPPTSSSSTRIRLKPNWHRAGGGSFR